MKRKEFIGLTAAAIVGDKLFPKESKNKLEIENFDQELLLKKVELERKYNININNENVVQEQFNAIDGQKRIVDFLPLNKEYLSLLDSYFSDLQASGLREQDKLINIFIGSVGTSFIDMDGPNYNYAIITPFTVDNKNYEGSIRLNPDSFKKAVNLEIVEAIVNKNLVRVNMLSDCYSAITHEYGHIKTLNPDRMDEFDFKNNPLFDFIGANSKDALAKRFKLKQDPKSGEYLQTDRWNYAGVGNWEFWAVMISSYTFGSKRFRNEYSKYFLDDEIDFLLGYLEMKFFHDNKFAETINDPSSYISVPLRKFNNVSGAETFFVKQRAFDMTRRVKKILGF